MNHNQNIQIIDTKNDEPFFSIVLPTKNRSFLVESAIKSTLMQSFKNFELIIVDNDDSSATKDVVDSFEDPRIIYYKTGNLSMPDNWEYGCTKITGKFLLILGDRLVLKPNSLQTLFKIIMETGADVIKWQHDFFNEDTGAGTPEFFPLYKAHFFDSDQIIKSFLDCDLHFFITHSPIGYDSCISQKVVKTIQNGPMKRLCVPASPDYTMSFQILHRVDKIFCIPDTLTTMGGTKYSNGMSFYRKEGTSELFITELKKQGYNLYSHSPIKVRTAYNTLVNDYINISNAVGGKLKKFQLNKFNYYLYIYDELIRAENENVDVTEELKGWNETLSMQDSEFIKKIRAVINQKKNKIHQNDHLWRIRYLIQIIPEIGLYNISEGVFKSTQWKLRKEKKFDNILEYVKTDY